MMQLKAIFSVILRDYEFEMAQPSENYRDDASKMVIQLAQPCRVRYRKRADLPGVGQVPGTYACEPTVRAQASMRVVADLDLCQAHQMCQGEAPEVFGFDEDADQVVVLEEHPDESLRPQVQAAVRYCPAMALSHRGGLNERPDRVPRSRSSGRPGSRSTGEAERIGDWTIMADWYAEDATYGWMYTPDEHFMAVGREEIRELRDRPGDGRPGRLALRLPVHDDRRGQGHGARLLEAEVRDHRRRHRPGVRDPRHRRLVVRRRATGRRDALKFAWQRDWFDLGSTATTFLAIAGSGKAPQGLLDRMSVNGTEQPGHYAYDELPSTLWPPPVEAGEYVTQEPAT